jgi:hypothetical protein
MNLLCEKIYYSPSDVWESLLDSKIRVNEMSLVLTGVVNLFSCEFCFECKRANFMPRKLTDFFLQISSGQFACNLNYFSNEVTS